MGKTTVITTWRDKFEVLEEPLSIKELKAAQDKEGNVSAILVFDLSDLIDNDVEWLNDEVSERITGSIIALTSIDFKPFGVKKSIEKVFVKVTGNITDFLGEELQAIEEEANA